MQDPADRRQAIRVSALGAGLAALCGLILWGTKLGEAWAQTSYDELFRFGAPAVTNRVTLIQMDNAAYQEFSQPRPPLPWDRALHARLLNRLADDGCPLVVCDLMFLRTNDVAKDRRLAAAIGRQRNIVLAADQQDELDSSKAEAAVPDLPAARFLAAARTNWGVGRLDQLWSADAVVRRTWPFPSPGPYPSLPWTAAKVAGARLSSQPQERWVRYYGEHGPWERMSYGFALAKPTNYFRNRIVFVGNEPESKLPDNETDQFKTPYTRWTGEACGGVEIQIAIFLNLLNGQSLCRPPAWLEILTLVAAGAIAGGGLCRLQWKWACVAAAGLALGGSLGAIGLSWYTNYWFPWLIVTAGQVPVAWVYATGVALRGDYPTFRLKFMALLYSLPALRRRDAPSTPLRDPVPTTPGYELIHPPFAEGSYGKVWLARNGAKRWVALKVVYQEKFGEDTAPYEREYKGVQTYQPLSGLHPGLLRVDYVSPKSAKYFYYVMELGDSLSLGWEQEPSMYKPRDLVSVRAELRGRRLPVRECVKIGMNLCDALAFLHGRGMAHRDIKPQNIIFVNGEPKLADMGLVAEIKPEHEGTLVGTPGFMPPLPERPGTMAADIYALGMALYVVSTGRAPGLFPEVATTLVSADEPPPFLPLNSVIIKACHPNAAERYATALEMQEALVRALAVIESLDTASH